MFAVCQIQLNSTNEAIKMFPQLIPCPIAIYNIKFAENSFEKQAYGLINATYAKFDRSLIEWIFMKVLLWF